MKKIFLVLFSFSLLFFGKNARAQTNEAYVNMYVVKSFDSLIEVEKDTSLVVTETINVNFPYPKHGIYRTIPVVYSSRGRTIRANLEVLDITDGGGKRLNYVRSRVDQSVELKIGDADVTLTGPQTYVIKYKIKRVIQKYEAHDEIYWNVAGSGWDTDILETSVKVDSQYAKIIKAECFAGDLESDSRECVSDVSDGEFTSSSETILGSGRDYTIVLGLSKDNDLVFPSRVQETGYFLVDNWGYAVALLPILVIVYFWIKKGRDLRYISEDIYYEPSDKAQRVVKLFERPHLPFVYHPISKISPGEAGTIVDERVHISDVVAEILELARLGFLTIRKIETKRVFGKDVEYAFVKTNKFDDDDQRNKLKDYQEYLLNELFRATIVHKSVEEAEKLFKNNEEKLAEVRQLLVNKEYVLLSGVKNHFYEGLPVFKDKLYKRMDEENIFDGDPEKTRGSWVGAFVLMDLIAGASILYFISTTANFYPLILGILGSIPGILVALAMPRRTAKGYSFFRQIVGLKWYLSKGEWRHKMAEKNLFIEEILPLAVALGVVDKITADMAELGIKPPSYFGGSSIGTFSRDLISFNTASSSSFMSAPPGKSSGSSSWSGGSGFSGGSSGGGFGGGGGGSW